MGNHRLHSPSGSNALAASPGHGSDSLLPCLQETADLVAVSPRVRLEVLPTPLFSSQFDVSAG